MPQIYSLKKDISFGAKYWALPEKKMVCGDQLITSFKWLKDDEKKLYVSYINQTKMIF